ncbi:MAG: phosphatidylcholine synthase [Gammaproteobacteria bacterium]|nr:phosphatidylcholine synthase [Gammaproteobacteria bacterium]|tara:strand:- start:9462 stop:10178 length:717 start_codon:yes stop_codon:yes gene_type:complete
MIQNFQSWLVHLFTATGALAGFLSLEAIFNNNIFLSFIWLSVAFFIDGIDGTLARRYKVKEAVPIIDGNILDNIIDYLNYVFIPAVMIYWFNLVPNYLTLTSVALILIVSCYTFSNTKLKTKDNYFRGFPAVWNIVLFYIFVLDTTQVTNFLIILFFSMMTFVPLKYAHPFRVEKRKSFNLLLTFLWGMCCVFLLLDLREIESPFNVYREIYFSFWIIINLYFIYLSLSRSFLKKVPK